MMADLQDRRLTHVSTVATFRRMSAMENKQLLKNVFEGLAAGNPRAMSDAMAVDFRWVFPGDWSWSGVWKPKEVVLDQLLRPLMAQFEGRYRSEADLIVADGDRVIVLARGQATTKRGDAYRQTYCYVFTVRGGQLREVVEYCDTALVERVLEPPMRLPAGDRTPDSGDPKEVRR
jgi:uncharacterized protein